MLLHSDTLFWFRDNQFLLYLLKAARLAEKPQTSIWKYSVRPHRWGSYLRSCSDYTNKYTTNMIMIFRSSCLYFATDQGIVCFLSLCLTIVLLFSVFCRILPHTWAFRLHCVITILYLSFCKKYIMPVLTKTVHANTI